MELCGEGVFLKRSARRPEADAGRVTVRNGLECKLNCANSKVSYVLDTEDVFVRRRGAAKPVLSTDTTSWMTSRSRHESTVVNSL